MSFTSLLVQTAEVYRRKPGLDRFQQPVEEFTLVGSYPCRVGAAEGGGEQNTERMRAVYNVHNTAYLAPEADVKEDDRIRVLDPLGNEIMPSANVTHRQTIVGYAGLAHHIECKLEVQRGPHG